MGMTIDDMYDWLYRLKSELVVYMPREWHEPMRNSIQSAIVFSRKYQMMQADYENRLKADLEAILVELQLEIEEKEQYYQDKFLDSKNAVHDAAMGGRMFGCGECKEVIQQIINALRGEQDPTPQI